MTEFCFSIQDVSDFVSEQKTLYVEIPYGKASLWPLALEYDGGNSPWKFELSANQDGLISISANSTALLENVLPPFCFMDGVFQIRMDGNTPPSAYVKDTPRAVLPLSGSFINSFLGDPKIFQASHDRVALQITCKALGQLSIDMRQSGEKNCFAGVTIDHQDGYANIYFDAYIGGLWQRDQRIRLGFIKYELGKPYSVILVVASGMARGTFMSIGQMKTFETPCSGEMNEVLVRESWSSSPEGGKYEVESCGP